MRSVLVFISREALSCFEKKLTRNLRQPCNRVKRKGIRKLPCTDAVKALGVGLQMLAQTFQEIVNVDKNLKYRPVQVHLEGAVPAVHWASLADVKNFQAAADILGRPGARFHKSALVLYQPHDAFAVSHRVGFQVQLTAPVGKLISDENHCFGELLDDLSR